MNPKVFSRLIFIYLISILCIQSSCGDFRSLLIEQLITWEDRPDGILCQTGEDQEILPTDFLSFSTEIMHCVEVTMKEDDLKSLKDDSRFGVSASNEKAVVEELEYMIDNCEEPWPNEFIWYKANININGKNLLDVGIRKKGLIGSLFSSAPSFKIKTDKFVDDQFFGSVERMTFNNNSEDETRIVSTLMYHIFNKINYPSPRCNLANVSLNNEPFGPYSNVEPVKKVFLKNRYGENTGDLYEGALVDFNVNWLNRWEPKTSNTDPSRGKLSAISEIIEQGDPGIVNKLSEYINLESFIRFWALEIITNHKDGYTANQNNFYVYFNPLDNDRAHFIPWGIGSYDAFRNNKDNSVIKGFTKSHLARVLSNDIEMQVLLKSELEFIITSIWDETELINLVDVLSIQIKSAQSDSEYDQKVEKVKNWIKNRKADVLKAINDPFPDVSLNLSDC